MSSNSRLDLDFNKDVPDYWLAKQNKAKQEGIFSVPSETYDNNNNNNNNNILEDRRCGQ